MESKGEVIIYKGEDGKNTIQVHSQEETVGLPQQQMTELFDRDQSVISRHIRNIFKEKELDEKSNMHFLHIANSDKPTAFYNLDVIISTGYRVKSGRGTQFRISATQTLKDHLVKGYTINEKRLQEQQEKFKELHQTVEFLKTTLGTKNISENEAQGLLEIISIYTRSFVLLNQFDSNSLRNEPSDAALTHEIKYEEAIAAIEQLKKKLIDEGEATNLFGRQREDAFSGILNSVVQTFGGECLYPGVEEQAAHLLYFVIKNHLFADGNKRIGAFLFVWFLLPHPDPLRLERATNRTDIYVCSQLFASPTFFNHNLRHNFSPSHVNIEMNRACLN